MVELERVGYALEPFLEVTNLIEEIDVMRLTCWR